MEIYMHIIGIDDPWLLSDVIVIGKVEFAVLVDFVAYMFFG